MKCKEERCRCGQDLTGIEVVEPVMWTVVKGKKVPYTECPRCQSYCILVEPEVTPEPPVVRGTRRRAPEPEPTPEPEPEP